MFYNGFVVSVLCWFPTELDKTWHDTEQVTQIFYSQQEALEVEGQFEFFENFHKIKGEKIHLLQEN